MSDNQFIEEQIKDMVLRKVSLEKIFRFMIKEYQKPLYATIYKITGEHALTDDVLQNVFLKVFKNWKSFDQKSSYFTWMYRIAINESITALGKAKRMSSLSINEIANHLTSPIEVDYELWIKTLQEGISILPEKQKMVFIMKYHDDHSYETIALLTNTSIGALKASYHHAIQKLKTHFIQKGLLSNNL